MITEGKAGRSLSKRTTSNYSGRGWGRGSSNRNRSVQPRKATSSGRTYSKPSTRTSGGPPSNPTPPSSESSILSQSARTAQKLLASNIAIKPGSRSKVAANPNAMPSYFPTKVPAAYSPVKALRGNVAVKPFSRTKTLGPGAIAAKTAYRTPTTRSAGGVFTGGSPRSGGSTSGSGGTGVQTGGVSGAPQVGVSRPVVAPTAQPQVGAGSSGLNPQNAGSFTSAGRGGTFGRFQRQRLGRGPRTGTSLTPEMIQRLAQQRFQQR
ncbi:MAG: hypothetical protein H0V81_17610 [Solirubrobacterales bacterium]|nr:hypothetical protein [Solirubrobacterales bacterium]